MAKKQANSADSVPASTAARGKEPAGEFMEVGQEVVPRDAAAVHLSRTYRNHRTHRPSQITWSPCGRFIASPSTDEPIRIWDVKDGIR